MFDSTRELTQSYYKTYKIDELESPMKLELKEKLGIDIEACLECGKCTGGCSNAHIFDYTPRKLVQLIKLGQEDRLYNLDALWSCVACQLCGDRCPAGIDIPRIIDYVREKAVNRGLVADGNQVKLFYDLMLESVGKTGRVAETSLMIKYNLKRGRYFSDADLGQKLFFKGKLKLLSPKVKNMAQLRHILKNVDRQREG